MLTALTATTCPPIDVPEIGLVPGLILGGVCALAVMAALRWLRQGDGSGGRGVARGMLTAVGAAALILAAVSLLGVPAFASTTATCTTGTSTSSGSGNVSGTSTSGGTTTATTTVTNDGATSTVTTTSVSTVDPTVTTTATAAATSAATSGPGVNGGVGGTTGGAPGGGGILLPSTGADAPWARAILLGVAGLLALGAGLAPRRRDRSRTR